MLFCRAAKLLSETLCGVSLSYSHYKQYAKAIERLADCGEKLLGVLDVEQRKLLERYTDDQREVSVIADCAAFISGFKLGAKIMLDVLTEGEMNEL